MSAHVPVEQHQELCAVDVRTSTIPLIGKSPEELRELERSARSMASRLAKHEQGVIAAAKAHHRQLVVVNCHESGSWLLVCVAHDKWVAINQSSFCSPFGKQSVSSLESFAECAQARADELEIWMNESEPSPALAEHYGLDRDNGGPVTVPMSENRCFLCWIAGNEFKFIALPRFECKPVDHFACI